MNENTKKIVALYDGKRSAVEVAKVVGLSPRYVRKVARRLNLDRLSVGAQPGKNNHQFVCGRRIDLDGYVLVTAPKDHPFARKRPGRENVSIISEHRLVMEQELGRYLDPKEAVDHIDGLTLHNHPTNLRLFQDNATHLRETITGIPKRISLQGSLRIRLKNHLPKGFALVDTYGLRRKRGDVRLRQILRAALSLGIDSPFLLGSHYHLERAGIDSLERSRIEQALDDLLRRWEQDLLR